jgi:2-hydroxychromene-2-carboxylate isomerase
VPEDKPPIEFWFDFISPFGWFASLRIDEVAARHGRTVDWRSMLLGVSVIKVMGLKPLLDTPMKGDYVRRDAARYARRHGLTFLGADAVPPISPLAPARAFQWVKAHHPAVHKAFAADLYRAYWSEARDIADPAVIGGIGAAHGVDPTAFAAVVEGEVARERLRAEVAASLDRGVFGSPFIIVDGEPFWAVEKMEVLEEWLARGGW